MKFHTFSRRRLAQTLMGLVFISLSIGAHAMDVKALIHHIDDLWRGETSQATMSMAVKTQRYQRSMTLESWSSGKKHSLVVIREPVKDRGVATLKVDENIWNYLPKINRVTKVPSSMMSGSWMGSHFTNDDLVKESTFEDDYTSTITFDGVRDGQKIYEIMSIAKPDAAVVWGKVVNVIDQKTLAPTVARYYDEEGKLIRTLRFDQVKQIGARFVPMRMILQPEDKPDESTVITYQDIRFGVPIEDGFFSLQNLQRKH